jgi:hypothetical protein
VINMEPLKPETKANILAMKPEADPADIEEYERLLAERFNEDPNLPAGPQALGAVDERQDRLAELYRKLFSE